MPNVLGKTLLVVCVAMVLSAGSTFAQIADFPQISAGDTLLKSQKQALADRVKWWKSKLMVADTLKGISNTCEEITRDYTKCNASDNVEAKNVFVAACVEQLLPLLAEKGIPLDDKLRREKLIQVASLLSKLRDRAIFPAIKSMSVDPNPAVRLIAWEGYKNSRSRLIASRAFRGKLLKSVADTLKTETNPIILQAVYRFMNFRGVDTTIVNSTVRKEINDFFLKTLEATWNIRRLGVQQGNVQKINRGTEEVAVLGYIGSASGVSQGTKVKVLQMLLDIASEAASVYDKTLKTDPKVNRACVMLLLECEQNLNGISEMQNQPILKGLISKAAPGAAVQGAIFTWSDALKSLGVKSPKTPAVKPPAAPADKPK
ncbi:MAG: hypothetical protein KAR11_08220 [Phycisphaerae bacterium]|nr:hypothetical protein [Phycisphaerae bacterium]